MEVKNYKIYDSEGMHGEIIVYIDDTVKIRIEIPKEKGLDWFRQEIFPVIKSHTNIHLLEIIISKYLANKYCSNILFQDHHNLISIILEDEDYRELVQVDIVDGRIVKIFIPDGKNYITTMYTSMTYSQQVQILEQLITEEMNMYIKHKGVQ